ncbi:MAG: hypothetical protein HQ541_14510 [Mariniphaga sp.]|nr:hypothetical protein [Mariniphaga sp.]
MKKQITETIHSDFLIHWTGCDIDNDLDKDWNAENASTRMSEAIVDAYIIRLKNILKFGFWMITSDVSEKLEVNDCKFDKPLIARTCFTELKLSDTRKHAQKFGRLGIGLKRFYLFDRLGGPMHYLQFNTENLFFPPYSSICSSDPELFSFFKHMCSNRPLTYDLFSESEWRIIFSENIKKKIHSRSPNRLSRFIDPKETKNQELVNFYNNIRGKKPDYFLPLDAWLAIIIYPSPEVKNKVHDNNEIKDLIKKVKSTKTVTGCPRYEYEMWPIEVDLDACSHF